MGFFNWLTSLDIVATTNTTQTLKFKDPKDTLYTKGNSTKWKLENYCTECNEVVTWDNSIDRKSCTHCGHMVEYHTDFPERNYRTIYTPDGWMHQYRYVTNEFKLLPNRL